MTDTFEYDVFLRYSSNDKQIVHALAERLRGDGVRVWLDDWVIQPGDPIGMKIQHGIEKSRTLVMCMSSDYFESEWGKLEHHSMLFRDPTNAKRRFLPLLIKQCKTPDINVDALLIPIFFTSDGQIRWMNITEYLQRHGVETKQVIFEGQGFTAGNVAKLRNELLRDDGP